MRSLSDYSNAELGARKSCKECHGRGEVKAFGGPTPTYVLCHCWDAYRIPINRDAVLKRIAEEHYEQERARRWRFFHL
jgi:hypothetical protein